MGVKTDTYDPKRQRKMTYITVILVVLVGAISTFLQKEDIAAGYLTFHNEGYMTLADEVGNYTDVYYTDILSAEYVEEPDFGVPAGGSVLDGELRLGLWESDTYGTYWNCTELELSGCVLIRTESEAFAVSHGDEETTRELHRAILDARERLLSEEMAK